MWIICLTIAACVLAQAAALIMGRSFDSFLLKNEGTVAQSSSESAAPLREHLNATDRNKSVSIPEGDTACGVMIEQVSDTRWILDRESMLADTWDVNRLLMQARAVPYLNQGRTVGFRITRISRGSCCEKIGLREGDVLLRVNMQKLDDPAKLLRLYQEMRNQRHISMLLSRNGQHKTFDYDIR